MIKGVAKFFSSSNFVSTFHNNTGIVGGRDKNVEDLIFVVNPLLCIWLGFSWLINLIRCYFRILLFLLAVMVAIYGNIKNMQKLMGFLFLVCIIKLNCPRTIIMCRMLNDKDLIFKEITVWPSLQCWSAWPPTKNHNRGHFGYPQWWFSTRATLQM